MYVDETMRISPSEAEIKKFSERKLLIYTFLRFLFHVFGTKAAGIFQFN